MIYLRLLINDKLLTCVFCEISDTPKAQWIKAECGDFKGIGEWIQSSPFDLVEIIWL